MGNDNTDWLNDLYDEYETLPLPDYHCDKCGELVPPTHEIWDNKRWCEQCWSNIPDGYCPECGKCHKDGFDCLEGVEQVLDNDLDYDWCE